MPTGPFTAGSARPRRRGSRELSTGARVGGWVVLLVYLAVLAGITLTPLPGALADRTANFTPGASFARYLADGIDPALARRQLGGNVAMFAPFGFILPFAIAAARKVMVTVPLALLGSATIEVVQATRVEGRVFDIDDVLLNVVGALLGLLLHRLLVRR